MCESWYVVLTSSTTFEKYIYSNNCIFYIYSLIFFHRKPPYTGRVVYYTTLPFFIYPHHIRFYFFQIAFSRIFFQTPFTFFILFFSNGVGSELRENAKKSAYFSKMSSFYIIKNIKSKKLWFLKTVFLATTKLI